MMIIMMKAYLVFFAASSRSHQLHSFEVTRSQLLMPHCFAVSNSSNNSNNNSNNSSNTIGNSNNSNGNRDTCRRPTSLAFIRRDISCFLASFFLWQLCSITTDLLNLLYLIL